MASEDAAAAAAAAALLTEACEESEALLDDALQHGALGALLPLLRRAELPTHAFGEG